MAFWKVANVHGLHGSRRPLSRAPHHEGLAFRRETRPHPEEPASRRASRRMAAERLCAWFLFQCDRPAQAGEGAQRRKRRYDSHFGSSVLSSALEALTLAHRRKTEMQWSAAIFLPDSKECGAA
jgi:hypothetical protein